jgi:hypothetical protein
MCVFVMLFVGDLRLQPHKHPQSTCFVIFLLVCQDLLFVLCKCVVLCEKHSRGACAIATMILPCLQCNFSSFFQFVYNVYYLLSNLV